MYVPVGWISILKQNDDHYHQNHQQNHSKCADYDCQRVRVYSLADVKRYEKRKGHENHVQDSGDEIGAVL